MTESKLENLKYPIGTFAKPEHIDRHHIEKWVSQIVDFPQSISELVNGLSKHELNYRYRPNGWKIKQVIHHCADSHMNCIIRFKLALTEDTPTIKPYLEDRWANLIDSNDDDLTDTLSILKGLHGKLGTLLGSLTKEELSKEFVHPQHGSRFRIDETIGMYAWHSNHHLAHVKQALKFRGKF